MRIYILKTDFSQDDDVFLGRFNPRHIPLWKFLIWEKSPLEKIQLKYIKFPLV